MKRVIHISADKIAMFWAGKVQFLDRNGVDMEIGKALVAMDKENPMEEVLVINGPGGFTNLRVGTLALNLLKTLKGSQTFSFFDLSKIELYTLAVKKGFLPRWGVIYIGQKMNVWLWDFETQALVKSFKKADLNSILSEYSEVFIDEVYEEGYFTIWDQLSCFFDEEGGKICRQGRELILSWEELLINPVERLDPNYMIEPNIS